MEHGPFEDAFPVEPMGIFQPAMLPSGRPKWIGADAVTRHKAATNCHAEVVSVRRRTFRRRGHHPVSSMDIDENPPPFLRGYQSIPRWLMVAFYC